MSFLLFMDESGHDLRSSPYEVLAGVCVEDRDLWNFICAVQDAEMEFFGQRITPGLMELKARKLLKAKTFRLARQLPDMTIEGRTRLARKCLEEGARVKGTTVINNSTFAEITALAQAKIAFVDHVLELCAQYRIRAFASIVDSRADRPAGTDFLRKDYAYLFERFFYFLDDQLGSQRGLVVFDELERSQCHLLVDQMTRYFRDTATGRLRSSLVIPEPFFVHSHLTTGVQVADLVAYIIAWGVRVGTMNHPRRDELSDLAGKVCHLRYRAVMEKDGKEDFTVWSFALIDDLRARDQRI